MRKETIPAFQAIDPTRENEEIDLLQLSGTLWRGKWSIALCVMIAVLVGGFYVFRVAVPKYTSSAVVALESRESQVVDFENVISGLSADQATLNTEVEVLRARILVGKLVDQLDLIADPEFNLYLRPKSPWSLNNLMMLVGVQGSTDPEPSDKAIRDEVIGEVLLALSVTNIPTSYVFSLSFETEDAEKSALIADTLAEIYINDQLLTRFQATERATAWLSEQVSQMKVELEEAETAVKEYNTAAELIGPEALVALNRQLKDFRVRLSDGERSVAEMTARIDAMEAARDLDDIKAMAMISQDQRLIAAADQLSETPGAQAAFRTQFEQALNRLLFERERGQTQIEAFRASVAEKQASVEAQSADLVKLQQLEREASANGLIYEYFLSRLKETSVQQGIQEADSRILSYAVVPDRPSKPRKSIILGLCVVLGTLVGSIIVLLREMRHSGFRGADDLERATGTMVIGQIPLAPNAKRQKVLNYLVSKPASALAEAIRNLRTSILLSDIDNPPKIIMLTSSVPGEGKTTQSLALAHNLAGIGNRVLVIEGDIRRRAFREYFDIPGQKGLVSVVTGDDALEDVVWHSEQLGLDILIGEQATINAADFFSSDKFAAFLATARETYDFILIDTPPVLVVPDPRVIAQSVDAVVYVVHWDQTPRSQIEQGLRAFTTVNVRVTGLVLSQIDPKGMQRYGGKYGDAYATYGSDYYGN